MNGKLPLLSAKELIKILNKIGFQVLRQRGSHVYLKHNDGRNICRITANLITIIGFLYLFR